MTSAPQISSSADAGGGATGERSGGPSCSGPASSVTSGCSGPRWRPRRGRVSRSRVSMAPRGSTSATSSASWNDGARASTSPSGPSTTLRPSKTSSSWPPTRLQKTTDARSSRARVRSISSRVSPLPTWYGEAEMLSTTVAPPRAARLPGPSGSQMSSQIVTPRRASRRPSDQRPPPGLERPLLVEDAVVRQLLLVVAGRDPAVAQEQRAVAHAVGVEPRAAHQQRHVDAPGEPLGLAPAGVEERGAEQQVLGRVAGDRELRRQHERRRPGGARPSRRRRGARCWRRGRRRRGRAAPARRGSRPTVCHRPHAGRSATPATRRAGAWRGPAGRRGGRRRPSVAARRRRGGGAAAACGTRDGWAAGRTR